MPPLPEPSIKESVDYALRYERGTVGTAVRDLDSDPDEAARAVQLGRITGAPPGLIYGDVEGFERNARADVVRGILDGNQHLQDLIAKDPMFSKVVSDDWGQISAISDAAKKHLLPGFMDIGFHDRLVPEAMKRIEMQAVGGFIKDFHSALAPTAANLQEEYWKAPFLLRGYMAIPGAALGILGAAARGAAGFAYEGAAQTARELGANEDWARWFGKGAGEFIDWKTVDIAAHGVRPTPPEVTQALQMRFDQVWGKLEPYLLAGKPIPEGIDPLLDRVRALEAEDSIKSIDAILDETNKSPVKERSPETMVNILKEVLGDRKIAIPYDVAQRLYGDKIPAPDDNMLGSIPGFSEKYQQQAATSGDILVPLAEYIGRVTPEVRTALKDNFKPSPDSMTAEQAKATPKVPVETTPEPARTLEDVVRDAAALNKADASKLTGLPKRVRDRLVKLADLQISEDKAWGIRKEIEEAARQRTMEWREVTAKLRPEVATEVANRPEWVAHDWFAGGSLRGVAGAIPKIDPKFLTPEQRKAIPKAYLKKGGSNPDDLARMAGFNTGDEMVNVMSRFYAEKGEVGPQEYLGRTVEAELQKRVNEELGKRGDVLLAEAQDHTISNSQLDRQHAMTEAMAIMAGQPMPYTRAGINKAIKDQFGRRFVGDQDRETYLREAGNAGRNMIEAFSKQDWSNALFWAQRQHVATGLAMEAKRFLKEKAQFERQMKRFFNRIVEGFDNPRGAVYVPYIHQIMQKIGRTVDRTPEDLLDAIHQAPDPYKGLSLEQFVELKRAGLKEVSVPEFLSHPNYKTPVEKMRVDEWRQVNNTLKRLITTGAQESKVYKEGVAHNLDEILTRAVNKIKEQGPKRVMETKKGGLMDVKKLLKTKLAESLTPESILNRIDEDTPMGVHNQFVMRGLIEGNHGADRMSKVYDKAILKAAGRIPNIDKVYENSLWINPETGLPLDIRKRQVLGMLMYWGNPSSRHVLLKGYNVPEELAYKWLLDRTTKEDWDRAQQIGHIFKRLIKEADRMSVRVSGTPIEKIEITPFDTPHGRYEGWYNPIEHSEYFKGTADVLHGAEIMEGEGFYRATTNQNYTMPRTGYVSPVELDLDMVPVRIRQMIHDINMREPVLQASKFFFAPEWRNAMIHYYGPHYEAQFIPFLKDIANYSNRPGGIGEMMMEKVRQNIIATMIGLNPHTVLKHGITAAFNSMREVGTVNWFKALGSLVLTNEETGNRNWTFAMDNSGELSRRVSNWDRYYAITKPEIALGKLGVRRTMIHFGSRPVAWSDLLSAVPTWLAQYEKSMVNGVGHSQAIYEADRAVRRAHGSSAITNLPGIMRTNAVGRTFTSLYGFFSHMLQKQFEIAWKAKDSYLGIKRGDYTALNKYKGDVAWGLVSYVLIPAVVEEIVTPIHFSEQENWGVKAAKIVGLGMSSSLVGVRDFAHGFVNLTDPKAGLLASGMGEAFKLARDLSSGKYDVNTTGRLIKEAFIVAGMGTGLTNAQMGRSAQFMYRWMQGYEHPQELWDILSPFKGGLTAGTLIPPRGRR